MYPGYLRTVKRIIGKVVTDAKIWTNAKFGRKALTLSLHLCQNSILITPPHNLPTAVSEIGNLRICLLGSCTYYRYL